MINVQTSGKSGLTLAPYDDKNSLDSEEENKYGASSNLDYSIPQTASAIFRANFIMNKTIKKKKNVKQWIPGNHELWFQLKTRF